jgi:hypothetical protein
LHHRLTVLSLQMVMLYVDEETSIKRQMERAKQAHMHNKRVMDAGAGELWCVVRPQKGICFASLVRGLAHCVGLVLSLGVMATGTSAAHVL